MSSASLPDHRHIDQLDQDKGIQKTSQLKGIPAYVSVPEAFAPLGVFKLQNWK